MRGTQRNSGQELQFCLYGVCSVVAARRSVKAKVLGSIPVNHPKELWSNGYDGSLSKSKCEFDSR